MNPQQLSLTEPGDLVRRIPQHVLNDFGAPRPDADGVDGTVRADRLRDPGRGRAFA